MKIAIGVKESALKSITDEMSRLLADTYALYLKTQNFHWNVTGINFQSLHTMFEQQYEELAEAVDVIAERIRALGFTAPASFNEFIKLTRIKDANGAISAEDMLKQLLHDHELLTCACHEMLAVAQNAGDEGTADLLVGRIRAHDKTAWMLRSSLNGK